MPSPGTLAVLAAVASTQISGRGGGKRQKAEKKLVGKRRASAAPAGFEEEGETSASDDRVVFVLSGQQDMVEESRKRKQAQQQRTHDNPAACKVGSSRQDAFAAFANQYRDVLRFADADEAEAVYSMVALTQARTPEWQAQPEQQQQRQPAGAAAAAAQAPEGRPAKRQQVAACTPPAAAAAAAAPACSEGGSSDSSAKSAPSPKPAAQQQQVQQQVQQGFAAGPFYPGLMMGPLVAPGTQAHGPPAVTPADPGAAGHMCMPGSMPMAPGFFPPSMLGMPGAPGCPMPPFLPPWAMPPGMMPMMFGSMGLFGPVPPGSPPLMPMAPPGMAMPGMPPAFMPGMPMVSGPMAGPAGVSEPAAGIPVGGQLPGAMKQAANARAGAAAARAPAVTNKAAGQAAQKGQSQALKQPQPAVPASGANMSPTSRTGSPAAAAGASTPARSSPVSIHQVLDQFDVVALKPWVLEYFCEDVYLLLLDVWRPDSAMVRNAMWAWKLHIKAPRPGNSAPDYRAFLVSLFGLEKLLELTAQDRAAKGSGSSAGKPAQLPAPALLQVSKEAGNAAATAAPADAAEAPVAAVALHSVRSGNSSAADTTAVAAAAGMVEGRNAAVLLPNVVVAGSAALPVVPGIAVQPQPA